MLSPTYEITTALSHTDELISPPYDIAIVTISYGRVIMSSVWDSMMSKKNVGWPFYAAVARCCIPDALCLLQEESSSVQNTSTLHFDRTYRGIRGWKWSIPCNKVNTRAIVYCRQLFCWGMCKCLYRFEYREQNYKKTNRLSNLILSKWLSGTPSKS